MDVGSIFLRSATNPEGAGSLRTGPGPSPCTRATRSTSLYGPADCPWARAREKIAAEVLGACSLEGDGVSCLSVRSGFDLLLEALALPHGSEVLVSAIMHPGMVRDIVARGLIAVPVDLDPGTLVLRGLGSSPPSNASPPRAERRRCLFRPVTGEGSLPIKCW